MIRNHLRFLAPIPLAFVAFGLVDFVVRPASLAQTPQAGKESQTVESAVSCTPERPTVWPRETIHARVWLPENSHRLQYAWSATGGRITGQTSEATWDFTGVQPGTYMATVEVTGIGSQSRKCSMQVIVMDREEGRGLHGLTGRSLLVGDAPETGGYGLYSYLLFANPPDDSSRERYTKALEAYVSLMPDVLSLEKYVRQLSQLNVTYVPIDTDPPKLVSADWILQHYNYARALVLLRAVPGSHRDGPYMVSSLAPLTGKESLSGDYLFQDLSAVPPHLISAWIKLFLNQASQERFWEPKSAAYFALKLRTAVGVVAVGLPEVQNALNGWIAWRRATSGS